MEKYYCNTKIKHTEEEVKDMIERYKNGNTVADIARRYGIGRDIITKRLKRNGVTIKPKIQENGKYYHNVKHKHTKEQVKDMIEMYQNGFSQKEIAKKYNVCLQVISERLTRNGIALRPKPMVKAKQKIFEKEQMMIADLFRYGFRKIHIAEMMEVSTSAICTQLEKLGLSKIKKQEHLTPQQRRKMFYDKNKNDPSYRLRTRMSKGMARSLMGTQRRKGGIHWEDLVGYTLADLKKHLEAKFQEGMTWDNHSFHGWHIDHIRPIKSFNITDYECDDFKKCWALENLQPLWCKDNISKSDNYPWTKKGK